MTTALQGSQAADKAADMEIIFKEICVPFLLTIIVSGEIASVSQEDCFHGSSAAAV